MYTCAPPSVKCRFIFSHGTYHMNTQRTGTGLLFLTFCGCSLSFSFLLCFSVLFCKIFSLALWLLFTLCFPFAFSFMALTDSPPTNHSSVVFLYRGISSSPLHLYCSSFISSYVCLSPFPIALPPLLFFPLTLNASHLTLCLICCQWLQAPTLEVRGVKHFPNRCHIILMCCLLTHLAACHKASCMCPPGL